LAPPTPYNGQPKPAFVAYANLIPPLSGARGCILNVKGRRVYALWFTSPEGCWAEVDIGSERAEVIDIMGRGVVIDSPKGKVEVWLSEAPIFARPLFSRGARWQPSSVMA